MDQSEIFGTHHESRHERSMALLSDRIRTVTRKSAFYARKLAWHLGLTSRFATAVGPLRVPRDLVSPAIFYHLSTGDYEVPELELLDQHMRPDDRVIELGAGLGFLANRYARRSSTEEHLAIEANPLMCDLARTNTASLPNVRVMNAVAARGLDRASSAAAPPDVPFHLYADFWSSSTEPIHLTNTALRLLRTVRVPVVDLDALIAERRCTMLVCDIEGGEYDLLNTFRVEVPKILLELHWSTLGLARAMQVMQTLASRGYRLSGSPHVLMATKA